jgi:hypothetical protein
MNRTLTICAIVVIASGSGPCWCGHQGTSRKLLRLTPLQMDLAESRADRFAGFWRLLAPEAFSASRRQRKSRAQARIFSNSPEWAKPRGLDGGASDIRTLSVVASFWRRIAANGALFGAGILITSVERMFAFRSAAPRMSLQFSGFSGGPSKRPVVSEYLSAAAISGSRYLSRTCTITAARRLG